jgi:hypothetical protein
VAAALASARRTFDPWQNPFLAAELRRQTRRGALPRSMLLHVLGLGLLLVLLLWAAWRPWPLFLGSLGPLLRRQMVVGMAALHGWLVVHASTSRAREAAHREEATRMWEMLVVTPLSAPEIVRYKSVYPFLCSCLIAIAVVPLYVLAAAVSGTSPGLIPMLVVVYLLVSVRLVSPVRPFHPRRPQWRSRTASSGGSLFLWLWVWLWVLTWAGFMLLPLTPLAGGLFLTWPVVAATVLPTPYPFYRVSLPLLVVVAALGPMLFALNLRGAAQRLVARTTETRILTRQDALQQGLGATILFVALGYAWPWLIERGSLGDWFGVGRAPGDSIAALGWLLLFGSWLLFGAGGLLSMDRLRIQAEARRPPGLLDRWLRPTTPRSGLLGAVAVMVAPPLLFLAVCCLLGWRLPGRPGLIWVGQTIVAAGGAAALTGTLARRMRSAVLMGSRQASLITWFLVLLLVVAPLGLLSRPGAGTLRAAALSPLFGFARVLPAKASLSPAGLGALPPWWLSPLLCGAAAVLLEHLWPVRVGLARAASLSASRSMGQYRRQSAPGTLNLWVQDLAERMDNPVLLKELRTSARRGGNLRGSGRLAIGAAIGLVALLPVLLPLYGTELGAYAPGGIPLRSYLSVVTEIGKALPIHFFPADLSGVRLFYASVMALLLSILGLVVPLSAPSLGAGTFAPERRAGTLGFLLMTPLKESEIVRGKLLAAAMPVLLGLALTFPAAATAALLSLSFTALGSLAFAYVWLIIDCFTGAAFGTLVSILLPRESEPMGPPLLAMIFLQGMKLYAVAHLHAAFTGDPQGQLPLLAWYVVPLALLEAGIGYLACGAGEAVLAKARRHDFRFVTER